MVETFIPGAFIASGTQVIASPTQFLFTGSEALRVIAYRTALDDLVVEGRFRADTDGSVKPFSYAFPGGASSLTTGDVLELTFPAGTLLNLRVGQTVQGTALNSTFVRVQQIAGTGSAAIVIGTLLQGYCSFKSDLGWPGSPLQDVHGGRGAITPIGSDVQGTSPLMLSFRGVFGLRYEVVGARVDIATSAVAGARGIFLQVGNSDGRYLIVSASTTLAASSARTLCWGAGLPARALDAGGTEMLPFPVGLELDSVTTVQVLLTNAQAGDAFTQANMFVRQWLDW